VAGLKGLGRHYHLMKVGLVSDVHGNRIALEAVFDDVPDVDALVCAGDVVGYNPWHADCVAAMRSRDVPTVSGNHDRAVAAEGSFAFNSVAAAGVDHAREQLDDDQVAWLRDLPTHRRLLDGRLRVVHGHPDDPDRYTYARTFSADLLDGADALVLGHTHVQEHRHVGDGVVVNPGSVGQPRDGDPRAAYAVLDLEDLTVDERRVAYDVDAVVAAVREAGLPERIGTRLRDGN
jgi:putative phosphoesterase